MDSPLKLVIFHSYVNLPEGKTPEHHSFLQMFQFIVSLPIKNGWFSKCFTNLRTPQISTTDFWGSSQWWSPITGRPGEPKTGLPSRSGYKQCMKKTCVYIIIYMIYILYYNIHIIHIYTYIFYLYIYIYIHSRRTTDLQTLTIRTPELLRGMEGWSNRFLNDIQRQKIMFFWITKYL